MRHRKSEMLHDYHFHIVCWWWWSYNLQSFVSFLSLYFSILPFSINISFRQCSSRKLSEKRNENEDEEQDEDEERKVNKEERISRVSIKKLLLTLISVFREMGVEGLKALLVKNCVKSNLKEFNGKTIGIDAFSLMYSAVRAIVKEENAKTEFKNGTFSKTCIGFCKRKIELYTKSNVTPYLVFDGDKLQMKEKLQRRSKKRKFIGIDEEKLKIQPSHVFYLIEYLKSAAVRYVVAPYEADAQLAWMARNNMVDAVQTDDSDLVLFGCPKVLFNLDLCVKSASLGDCLICELDSILKDNFPGLSREQFVQAFIFAGCDYIQCLSSPSFRKNGIAKGIRLIRDHCTYDKVITHLSSQWSKNIISVEEFRIKFEKVVLLYKHQCVYDLQKEQAAYLTSLPESFTFAADPTLEFLGKLMPNDEMKGIAAGDINPKTRKAIAMRKGGKPL